MGRSVAEATKALFKRSACSESSLLRAAAAFLSARGSGRPGREPFDFLDALPRALPREPEEEVCFDVPLPEA